MDSTAPTSLATIVDVTQSGVVRASQPGEAAQAFAEASRADNTKRAYRADWQHFTTWGAEQKQQALPAAPATVADYLAAHAETLATATLTRRMAAISQAHQLAGHATPTQTEMVRTVMKGIRRTKGTAQRQAAPAVVDVVRQMVRQLPEGLAGQRDRALLLLGFAGAFRRSELVGLRVADLRFVPEGLVVRMRKSKTDQEGESATKGIPFGTWAETCPVRALKAWLKAAALTEGPIFRPIDRHGHLSAKALSGAAVGEIVKKYAEAAGFDPDEFSGHSLRAGLATSAASAGVNERTIAKQTGHKSERMLRRYIREGELFRDNAAGSVGL